MTKYKVKVPWLNVREYPVADFKIDNIITVVPQGLIIDVEEVTEYPNPHLGKWYKDSKNQYYNEIGLILFEETSDLDIKNQLFDISQHWWLNDFKIKDLWNKGLTGAGIKIVVLDTGVSLPHPDLNINPITNCVDITNSGTGFRDIDKDSHGTHCIGIVKSSNNGFGITGIAFDSNVMACKISMDVDIDSGLVDDDISYLELGINWAIKNGADIISISKGFYNVYKDVRPLIKKVFEENNILIIAAGGNHDSKHYSEIFYPAYYDECLSVGALGQNNTIFPNTITSNRLKLLAPGVDIISTSSNKGYRKLSGSSQATPFVAGIAAIAMQYLKEKNIKYNAKGVYKLLIDASDSIENCNYKIINPINIIKLIDNGQKTFI